LGKKPEFTPQNVFGDDKLQTEYLKRKISSPDFVIYGSFEARGERDRDCGPPSQLRLGAIWSPTSRERGANHTLLTILV
jgi:hypothetical protein